MICNLLLSCSVLLLSCSHLIAHPVTDTADMTYSGPGECIQAQCFRCYYVLLLLCVYIYIYTVYIGYYSPGNDYWFFICLCFVYILDIFSYFLLQNCVHGCSGPILERSLSLSLIPLMPIFIDNWLKLVHRVQKCNINFEILVPDSNAGKSAVADEIMSDWLLL